MQLVDFVQVALVGLVNRELAAPDPALAPWVEEHGGFALASQPEDRLSVGFVAPEGARLDYPAWLASLRARRARRLRLVQIASLPLPEGIGARQIRGFANSHPTALALDLPQGPSGFRAGMVYPPETDLTHEDVLRFVAESPEREYFQQALLWQDRHNLHFTDGKSWERFVAALHPDRDEPLVSMFSVSVSNVAVSEATAERWRELELAHATRHPPELLIRELGPLPALVPAPDLASAARELAEAIDGCLAFARAHGLEGWARVFKEARAHLDAGLPDTAAGPAAILTRLYPPDVARLLAGIDGASVFGAMGSWNDLGYEGDPEYDRVSDRLLRAIDEALLAACG